jgi:hypothetical protein
MPGRSDDDESAAGCGRGGVAGAGGTARCPQVTGAAASRTREGRALSVGAPERWRQGHGKVGAGPIGVPARLRQGRGKVGAGLVGTPAGTRDGGNSVRARQPLTWPRSCFTLARPDSRPETPPGGAPEAASGLKGQQDKALWRKNQEGALCRMFFPVFVWRPCSGPSSGNTTA